MLQLTKFEIKDQAGATTVTCIRCRREHRIEHKEQPSALMIMQLINWCNNHDLCGKDRW